MQIGFIGVGLMGYGIALNLLNSGHSVRVIVHRTRDRVENLVMKGAVEAHDYAELLADAEAVFSCVGTAEQVEEVVTQAEPYLIGNTLWVDCATSKPQTAVALYERLKTRQVDFVDAPVTRGPKDAESGRLVSLVGADDATFERARPLIACYSESVTHLGPVGSGLRVKLLNNFITMGQVALVVEAMKAADRAGIDRRTLFSILVQGAANSGTLQKMVSPALDGDYRGHAFSLGNGTKDVGYGSQILGDTETGKILTEALNRYYTHQLRTFPPDTLLSELLIPERS